ncbi:MAG: DUF4412 domain-containing protein [Gemmatimonadales bacterium]
MNRVTRATALTLLISAGPTLAQAQAFEGVVNWKMKGDRGATEMVQMYRGGVVRTEMTGGGFGAVMLMDGATMTTIMPEQKMYMTMDLKKMGEQMKGMRHDSAGKSGPAKLTDEGTKETIAGYTCENYLVGDAQDMEMCVAKGLGYFAFGSAGGPMGGRGPGAGGGAAELAANPEWAKVFKDGFFPLRISNLKGSKREMVMEATKIEPKALDPSLFKVPDGYAEMKLPMMPQGH